MTHGWPGSFLEMLEMIPLLTNPAEHGLDIDISFDLVVPSLPGFGFSDRPQIEGANSFRVAEIWVELMRALGYDRFAAQGGDLGASVSTALGLRHSEHLIGVHLNYIPDSYKPYLAPGTEITAAERQFQAEAARWYDENGDYALTLISLFQMAVVPPSTNNSTPFKKLESPEARNSATVATSSDLPIFPRGIRDSNISLFSLPSRWESGVSICPGLSTFTRIFLPFSSLSHVRTNERNAALLAAYRLNSNRGT